MIDLRQLRQFIAVAEELHFHRAAKRLHMAQPPLTVAIRRLEDEIGALLLERGNRVVRLTPAGQALLEHARLTVAQAEQAVAAARDAATGRTGTLRLTYVPSAMYGRLTSVIRTFRRAYPEVRLELREATTAAQVTALHDETTDLAVLHPPMPDDNSLCLTAFEKDQLAIAVPAAHELARRSALSLADLADEPFVMWPAAEGRGFHDRVIQLCSQTGFAPQIVQEAHQIHGVLALVAVEAGVSVVPAQMASVRRDEVHYRPIDLPAATFTLYLGRRDEAPSAAMQNFIRAARQYTEDIKQPYK